MRNYARCSTPVISAHTSFLWRVLRCFFSSLFAQNPTLFSPHACSCESTLSFRAFLFVGVGGGKARERCSNLGRYSVLRSARTDRVSCHSEVVGQTSSSILTCNIQSGENCKKKKLNINPAQSQSAETDSSMKPSRSFQSLFWPKKPRDSGRLVTCNLCKPCPHRQPCAACLQGAGRTTGRLNVVWTFL